MNAHSALAVPAGSPPVAWWRLPIVWLALGLPGAVVVGGVFVAILAWQHVDPVVADAPAHTAKLAAPAAADGSATQAMEPALRARNHAATPRR
ncbi:MAG TPA: nitrogen fixation protein FixH [Burkholderiaceae bacterium]